MPGLDKPVIGNLGLVSCDFSVRRPKFDDNVGVLIDACMPAMQSSTVGAKRSFLQGKGVTDEEIDEAFKRASTIATQPAQAPGGTAQAVPSSSTAAAVAQASAPQPAMQLVPAQRASWVQNTASVALLACAAYGVGSLLTPYAKRCWRYFRPGDPSDDVDLPTQMTQMLNGYSKKQDEQLQQVTEATTAVALELKEQTSKAEETQQQSSADMHAYLQQLKDEVTKLNIAMVDTAAFSQELTARYPVFWLRRCSIMRAGRSA